MRKDFGLPCYKRGIAYPKGKDHSVFYTWGWDIYVFGSCVNLPLGKSQQNKEAGESTIARKIKPEQHEEIPSFVFFSRYNSYIGKLK